MPQTKTGYFKLNCAICGNEFGSNYRDAAQYCSNACKQKAYRLRKSPPTARDCAHCGKPVTGRKKYCDAKCRQQASRHRRSTKYAQLIERSEAIDRETS